jgi:hypothetical protein
MAKRPSSWVNLQDYLDLNRDAGAAMGQQLVGDVSNTARKAGEAITSAETQFGYSAAAGVNGAPDDAARVHGKNANLYSPEEAQARAMGGYTGPESLGDISPDLYGQVQDAVARVKAAQDPAMMGGQLAQAYGGQAGSGAGGQGLDAFLTGATSAAELSGLNTSYGGLMDTLGIGEKDAHAMAGKYEQQSDANAQKWANLVPILKGDGTAATDASKPGQWRPNGYDSYHQFMDKGGLGQVHEAAMYASPADWATRGLGELGYDGENASQLYVKMFGGGVSGNQQGGTGDWGTGNLRSAARLVQDQYGDKAVQAWFDGLTPEAWQEMMNTGNAGGQARKIRKWLSEHGYSRIR